MIGDVMKMRKCSGMDEQRETPAARPRGANQMPEEIRKLRSPIDSHGRSDSSPFGTIYFTSNYVSIPESCPLLNDSRPLSYRLKHVRIFR